MKLDGIVYLHDIGEAHMPGSSQRAGEIKIFDELCGEEARDRVVLATTKWNDPQTPGAGERRQQQLEGEYWKGMIGKGSVVRRYGDSQGSAREILDIILNNARVIGGTSGGGSRKHGSDEAKIQIQRELVDLSISLPETEAGKKLRLTIEQYLKEQKENMAEGDELYKQLLDQLKALKIPLSLRIRRFCGF